MRVNIKLRHKYLVFSALLATTIALFVYLLLTNQHRQQSLNDYKDLTASFVNNLASEELTNLEAHQSLKKNTQIEDFKEALTASEYFSSVSITDPNGTVVASDNASLLNTPMLGVDAWQEAVGGTTTVDKLDTKSGRLSLYLPIENSKANIIGVVSAEGPTPESLNNADEYSTYVGILIGAGSLLFVLIAYAAMTELEGRMQEKERSAFDKSKALEEEQQLYEAITLSLAESLIVINRDGQIMLFNKEAEKITGKSAQNIEYRSYKKIINFYTEKGKKVTKDPITEALKSGRIVRTTSKDDLYMKNPQGELFPVSVNVAPIREEKSFIKGVAVTIEDTSTERELQAVKDEFVFVVAHELGNPIFALDGYLSIMEGRMKGCDKETKGLLNDARRLNTDLSNLVNDLLEVARNETGRLDCELEKIDLSEIAAEVVKNESFKAKKKKIKISLKKTKLPKVIGNEKKIKEVITNLVNNAVKYNKAGGKVEVKLEKQKGTVRLSVHDTGFGLTKEELEKLFTKFYRVKNKETENITGTGLGLFISKQIVEKCGGKIWAESEKGKGTTFYFTLKIAK